MICIQYHGTIANPAYRVLSGSRLPALVCGCMGTPHSWQFVYTEWLSLNSVKPTFPCLCFKFGGTTNLGGGSLPHPQPSPHLKCHGGCSDGETEGGPPAFRDTPMCFHSQPMLSLQRLHFCTNAAGVALTPETTHRGYHFPFPNETSSTWNHGT